MKIIVVSDIHSNYAALSSIQESYDACLFLGDAVDYLTNPVPCVEWLRENALFGVRGNHDHAVAQRILPRQGSGLKRLASATRPLHWETLNRAQLRYLAKLPVMRWEELDGLRFTMVHATPRDPMDEYLADNQAVWKLRISGLQTDFLLVGHTHIPYILDVEGTTVLNPGSVGQPRDGDPRLSYAVIENGRATIRRIEYDIQAAVDQMHEAGVDDDAIQYAEQMLRTGGKIRTEKLEV